MSARSIPLPRVAVPGRLPVPGPHLRRRLVALVLLAGLLVAGFLVFRESSLVAVDEVEITGAAGRDADRVRAALTDAARDMTTMSVDVGALRTAVAPYPIVKDVRVTTDFPDAMRITVIEHVPVVAIVANGRRIAVAADGTLLPRTNAAGLPALPLRGAPAGGRVEPGLARRIVAVLGAAPAPLRARVEKVFVGPRGLTLRLDSGTALYFGSTERPAAKWAATSRVLADPSSQGATHLDVRLPERPAAGGLEQVAAQRQQTAQAGGTAPDAAAAPDALPAPEATSPAQTTPGAVPPGP